MTGRCIVSKKDDKWPKNSITRGDRAPERFLIYAFEKGDIEIRLCSRMILSGSKRESSKDSAALLPAVPPKFTTTTTTVITSGSRSRRRASTLSDTKVKDGEVYSDELEEGEYRSPVKRAKTQS